MPFRRIPALHLPHALGVLAVPLVIPLRLKPPAAFFPQTDAPPQPPPPGRDTSACRKMRMSHGSAYSLGAARGGVASSSGTPLSAHDSARRGHRAAVAPVHGPFCRSASIHTAADALRSSTAWPTKAKETRKETSQICAPLKETSAANQNSRYMKSKLDPDYPKIGLDMRNTLTTSRVSARVGKCRLSCQDKRGNLAAKKQCEFGQELALVGHQL